MNKKKFREEQDSIGKIDVPIDKYWGAQTQRSLMNFQIGSDLMPKEIIKAFAIQKKSAAISNLALNKIEEKIGNTILEVCDEIIEGKLFDHFPLSVWQTGSGTQTNMNLNEVLANRGNEILGKKIGKNQLIHPNDHCNLGQSSNDSFPTAMHIAIVIETNEKLLPVVNKFEKTLQKKEDEYSNIVKIGRTHLQDAVPLTLGQELSSFKEQIRKCKTRINLAIKEILSISQGATAVGTGLNTSDKFVMGFVRALQEITSYPFQSAENKFESISSHESIVNFSGAICSLTTACYKIANDIRLLASGPRCGISELILPANEPGSSIMPGKVNPTQSEALIQVCIYLLGYNNSLSFAASQGHFQLNANKTLMAHIIIRSINLISDAIDSFEKNCLSGMKPNLKIIDENLKKSLMLVTALNPKLGYDKSAKIAKKAFDENLTLKQAAVKLGYVSDKEFDEFVNTINMTKNSSQ